MSCFAIHLDYFINNRLVLVLQGGYFFIRTMIKNTIIRIVTMYSIAIHPLYESVETAATVSLRKDYNILIYKKQENSILEKSGRALHAPTFLA